MKIHEVKHLYFLEKGRKSGGIRNLPEKPEARDVVAWPGTDDTL